MQQGLDRFYACELGGGDDGRALGHHDPLDPTGGYRASDEPDPSCPPPPRPRRPGGRRPGAGPRPPTGADSPGPRLEGPPHPPSFLAPPAFRSRVIDPRRRAKTRRGSAWATASPPAANNPADRSSASG